MGILNHKSIVKLAIVVAMFAGLITAGFAYTNLNEKTYLTQVLKPSNGNFEINLGVDSFKIPEAPSNEDVFEQVNIERKKAGLNALQYNPKLQESACQKSI